MHFTSQDVLNGFLQTRVYPPGRARAMFSRSAQGERPLSRRLVASLGNYCTDLGRSIARRREHGGHDDLLASAPAASTDPLPACEEVESVLARQMAAIRAACAMRRRPRGAAYRESLLLCQRLDMAGAFDGVELRSERTGQPVLLDLSRLEQLTVWTDDETVMPLVEGGVALGSLWQQVRTMLLESPERHVSIEQLAPLIPVGRGLWNTWISRGRRKVRAMLGADCAGLFATWEYPREGA